MKVMIAAGGTGGHIYPALALADVYKEKYPGTEISFFGSSNRMESKLIPNAGYPFYGVEMQGTNGGVFAKFQSLLTLMKAQKYAKALLKKEKPDICIGFGNYISVPLINAAKSLGIKTMIHEQNSFAGKANKYLSSKVDAIASCYEVNLTQMPADNQRVIGNPEATLAAKTTYDPSSLEAYGLKSDVPFVLFMMGSLGSASVSKVIDEACPLFDDSYQVLIAAGKSNDYTYKTESTDRIKIVEFVDGKSMLKGCDLAVVRAGATTMAEISAIGTASILIPSPYVPNNHQFFNANELAKTGGAFLLEEKDLNAKSLADAVNGLMADADRRNKMKQIAYEQGKREAADEMIEWIERIVHG